MTDVALLQQDQISEVMSPFRQRLLAALRRPDSASGVAQKQGMSRQRVGYHMRALEKAGCLELVEQRQRRGCVERVLRARPVAFAQPADDTAARDRYAWSSLINVLCSALAHLAGLRVRADRESKRLATLALELDIAFDSPSARKAFTEELIGTIEHLVEQHHRPDAAGARRFRVLVGSFPSPASAPRESKP